MATQLEYHYYRTVDKSEIDLVINSSSDPVPIEVKLSSVVNRKGLRGLNNFLADTRAKYAILINSGKRIELLTDTIIQIPVNYILSVQA